MDPLRFLLSILPGTWLCNCSVSCWELSQPLTEQLNRAPGDLLPYQHPVKTLRANVISSPPHMQTIIFVSLCICQQLQKVHQYQTNLSQVCTQSANHIIASENKQATLGGFSFLVKPLLATEMFLIQQILTCYMQRHEKLFMPVPKDQSLVLHFKIL